MLPMCASVAGIVIIVHAAGTWASWVVATLQRSAGRTKVIQLALVQKRIVLVVVAVRGGSHSTTARSEIVLFVEIASGVGREGILGLRRERCIRSHVGQGAGATEMGDVAERYEAGRDKQKTKNVIQESVCMYHHQPKRVTPGANGNARQDLNGRTKQPPPESR